MTTSNKTDDDKATVIDSGGIDNTAIAVALTMLLVYLILNVVGTVYFVKLQNVKRINSSRKSGALASVIIGWLLCPLVNITSPIMFSTDK